MSIIGFASLISCTTGWCPSSRGTFTTSLVPVTVVNPLGGLLNAWSCALPAMVPGGTSADPFPGDLFPFQGCQDGFPSNCAQVPTYVLGRLAVRPFPVFVLVSLLQWLVELFPLPAGWIMRLIKNHKQRAPIATCEKSTRRAPRGTKQQQRLFFQRSAT